MKQYTITFLFILLVAVVAGCRQQEEPGSMELTQAVITATIEGGNNTKTMLGAPEEGVYHPLWQENDQVAVYAGSTGPAEKYTLQSGAGTDKATFRGVETDYPIVGLYPYSCIIEGGYSDNVLTLELPAVQQYCKGSFGDGVYPMLAVSQTSNLTFMNLCAILRLSLTGTEPVEYIRFKAHDAQMFVSGRATVRTDFDTSPELVMKSGGSTKVTLVCGGVNLDQDTPTEFFLVIPAGTYKGGFDLEIASADGKEVRSIETDITFERSQYRSVPEFAFNPEGPDIPIPNAVDLGLTSGLKWAAFNLGASAPEEYGDYYAWGETEPYSSGQNSLTWEDGKTVLDFEDDAAYVNLGRNWRMPTAEEWDELTNECTWIWTTKNSVYGRLVISKTNGSSIFLPAAGCWYYGDFNKAESEGWYWSSSFYRLGDVDLAWYVNFWPNSFNRYGSFHFICMPIRPVSNEGVPVASVTLDQSSIVMTVGNTTALTATVLSSDATQPTLIWSSSNPEVATVDYAGVVTAVSGGFAIITATTYDGGLMAACTITVLDLTPTGTVNGYEYVDLGLTSGLKWASYNVGAFAPEEYGDYFAWGETEPHYSSKDPLIWKDGKFGYNFDTYKFRTSGDAWNNVKFSKYNTSSDYGPVDNKTVLDPEDDAATVNWGGTWRMPTLADWHELLYECTWTWATQNGVYGMIVTSNTNGRSIFLPAAGTCSYSIYNTGSAGGYGSSSLAGPYQVYDLHIDSGGVDSYIQMRPYANSVRPVTDEGVRVSVTNVSLDNDSLNLTIDETATLTATVTPSNATQPAVIWSSSDNTVATVDYTGKVTAVAAGTATITAKAYDGGFTATCAVTVKFVPGAVDLGLTSGLKWATCNVGATAPEEYGDYFAWGGTEPQSSYDWTTCPFRTSGDSWDTVKFSKYNTSSDYGPIDNNTVLDPEDDAAAVNWGGSWRMPTDAEWTELRTECSWRKTTQNGVNGYLVTGTNQNSIFLPAAGYRYDIGLYFAGSDGLYWSSSLGTGGPDSAGGVGFSSDNVDGGRNYRYYGQSVRPVTE